MKLKLLALLLTPTLAFAAPTSTTTTTQSGEGKIDNFVRLYSHHHFHIRNDSGVYKIFNMTMTLCPVGKENECVSFADHVGLSPGAEFNYDKNLSKDVIYRTTGEKSVVAATGLDGVTLSSDQKYIWIHY